MANKDLNQHERLVVLLIEGAILFVATIVSG